MTSTSLELETRSQYSVDNNENHSTDSAEESVGSQAPGSNPSLEPADGGPSAWKLLIAAFMFEAILWGASRSSSYTQSVVE